MGILCFCPRNWLLQLCVLSIFCDEDGRDDLVSNCAQCIINTVPFLAMPRPCFARPVNVLVYTARVQDEPQAGCAFSDRLVAPLV